MNATIRALTFTVLAAPLFSACSTTVSQTDVPEAPYYVGLRVVVVDHEYIHRYACANGKPLMCQSTGRLTTASVCQCR
jgi:hypothetical protein